MKLKITANKIDTGGGTFRYNFSINPLVQGSGVYQFMRYCLECDIQDAGIRKNIAADLREKHRKTWERYHMWKESRT